LLGVRVGEREIGEGEGEGWSEARMERERGGAGRESEMWGERWGEWVVIWHL
jgi:hypothetical protein